MDRLFGEPSRADGVNVEFDGPDAAARHAPPAAPVRPAVQVRQPDERGLSREAEIALAKRVEAAERAVLGDLFQIPLAMERVIAWQEQLAEGRLRPADLHDTSTHVSGAETDDQDDVAEASGPAIDRFAALANAAWDAVRLARKRFKQQLRGNDLGGAEHARLRVATSRLTDEAGSIHLRANRISELVLELEREHRKLCRAEQGLVTLADRAGIPQQDWHLSNDGRELDTGWLDEVSAAPVIGWQLLTRQYREQLVELRAEVAAVCERVGLPGGELRRLLSGIGKARRELRSAREALVRAHLPLVQSVARRYRLRTSLDINDLVQEGNMGLMHAVEKFDHRRGVRLSTYAVWWIRQSISRAIADQGRTIRVPVHMKEMVARVLNAQRRYVSLEGRTPTAAELAASAGIPLARVEQVFSLVQEPTSLDLPVGEDGDATLGDLLPATDAVDPHAAAEASALKASLNDALTHLSPKEQTIIRLRFGLDGSTDQTLEEISKIFGVTRERIRQIEAKALEKLRHPKHARTLSVFVEA